MTRSEQMRQVRGKDTAPELALRSALHRLGLRYRLQRKIANVRVDILFVRQRVAVLVDGCFWHGCPIHATYPKTNVSYWRPKLAENKARDRRQAARLRRAGWKVVRVWEHACVPLDNQVLARIARACRKPHE